MAMQSVFELRKTIVDDYEKFSRSFSNIKARDILDEINKEYGNGRYWPDAMIQINPHYETSESIETLAAEGSLHPGCVKIFRSKDNEPLTLYKHQVDAIAKARENKSFIVTTGTGSGKSLAFFIPIIDRVLRNRDKGIAGKTKAIVIYPMNALANSQMEELGKYRGAVPEAQSFSFARYTGQDDDKTRQCGHDC